ncbi:MAG TPA: hypothetical protein DEA22_03525, partial [Blastocatellia bacterium]|nr:hypothetical protein [Blastocatellia bacterium]
MPISAGSDLMITLAGKMIASAASVSGRAFALILFTAIFAALALNTAAQDPLENAPLGNVSVVISVSNGQAAEDSQLGAIAHAALGDRYSTVRIRDAIEQLFLTGRVVTAEAEAIPRDDNSVDMRFNVRLKTRARRVTVSVVSSGLPAVTEQEILLRVNLLDPGASVSEQSLQNNANLILEYLRDRGYFRAEVSHSIRELDNETDVEVAFRVRPGEQARVETFD